jgi:hypothetical protein
MDYSEDHSEMVTMNQTEVAQLVSEKIRGVYRAASNRDQVGGVRPRKGKRPHRRSGHGESNVCPIRRRASYLRPTRAHNRSRARRLIMSDSKIETHFRDWVRSAHASDNVVGDFIRDARRDSEMPADFPSLRALRGYVLSKGGCREAIATAPAAWRRFEAWRNRRIQANGDGR